MQSCLVCLNECDEQQKPGCGCTFYSHNSCWLKCSRRCPICRQKIPLQNQLNYISIAHNELGQYIENTAPILINAHHYNVHDLSIILEKHSASTLLVISYEDNDNFHKILTLSTDDFTNRSSETIVDVQQDLLLFDNKHRVQFIFVDKRSSNPCNEVMEFSKYLLQLKSQPKW